MMEDGVLSSDTMLCVPGDSAMDFDYMDELLFEGFWLETTDGSEYLNPSPSFPPTFFDPSFVWPNLEPKAGPSQNSKEEDKYIPWLPGNSPSNELQGVGHVNAQSVGENTASVAGCGNNATEGSELGRRWWVGPTENPDPAASVKTRLVRALEHIKDLTKDEDILIQLWVPVNRGGKRFLTTHNQPYALGPSSERLASYRDVSVKYHFPVEEDSKDFLGLPGRVFLGKVPEWSPDVRFFRSEEYPRVLHAQRYDVRGTLALPVFEQGSRTCLGVVEVVMTTQKTQYRPELETVCKALEAVDLRGSDIPSTRTVEAFNTSYQAALPEILEVLRSACETHRLPLGQTWVPCVQQGKAGCRHSDENYSLCVSTADHACYVADHRIQPFHEACSDHHLLKGQGLVGRAFLTNQPCFHSDITSFSRTEYPLSHHARMFGLHAAVAIRLRSTQTGSTDFVLEFFLPVDCKDPEEQKKMLTSLSTVIQQVCRTLRVVTDEELEEEAKYLVSDVVVPADGAAGKVETLKVKDSHSGRYARDDSSWTACRIRESGNVFSMSEKDHKKVMSSQKSMDSRQNQEESNLKGRFESVPMSKTGERRRTKTDKGITLQVLRQYFAGSLKDAAKSIGVCPTTLKRICRQHGITRWPSRKIKKVGHSLQKLQLVIDSVQGASGTLQVDSFYKNYPALETSNLSITKTFSSSNTGDDSKPSYLQPDGSVAISYAAAPKSPSSSCGQSSSSSHSNSSGTQQSPSMFTPAANEDPLVGENIDRVSLKSVRSSSELLDSGQVEGKLLPRSQSLVPLRELSSFSNLPPLPENNSQLSEATNFQRVKISHGTENIRLRMPYSWRYEDLLHETARRFNIDDISRFDLKYLDDDCEWVLLTCDDDLKECVEICQSSGSHTVKLSLQVSHLSGRGLFGSL